MSLSVRGSDPGSVEKRGNAKQADLRTLFIVSSSHCFMYDQCITALISVKRLHINVSPEKGNLSS